MAEYHQRNDQYRPESQPGLLERHDECDISDAQRVGLVVECVSGCVLSVVDYTERY